MQTALLKQPSVLAFVGENENLILQWWMAKILYACAARGNMPPPI
jgi:hypothetical protein